MKGALARLEDTIFMFFVVSVKHYSKNLTVHLG